MKKKSFSKFFFFKLFFTSSRPQRNLKERFKKFEKEKKELGKKKKNRNPVTKIFGRSPEKKKRKIMEKQN